MMPVRASLILCAAMSAACGPVRSDDAFSTFKSMCIDTQADQDHAMAAADKAGWLPMPQPLAEDFLLKTYKGTGKGRTRTTPERVYLLKTANAVLPTQPGGHGPMCSLGMSGMPVDFDKQAETFAAVPKHGEGIYLWREKNGAHIAVNEGDTLKSAPLHFLFGSHGAGSSLLIYGIVSSQD